MEIETFPALQLSGVRHGFRRAARGRSNISKRNLMPPSPRPDFPCSDAVHAEQPHGNRAQAVYTPLGIRVPDVDALATSCRACRWSSAWPDCGPVFFYDPVQQAIAVATREEGHRGKHRSVNHPGLRDTYETETENLIVQLGPASGRHITKSIRGGDRTSGAGVWRAALPRLRVCTAHIRPLLFYRRRR